jgi:hypothetical protein
MLNCFAHVRTPENLMGVPLRALARAPGVFGSLPLVECLQASLYKEALFAVELLRSFIGRTCRNGRVFRVHEGERDRLDWETEADIAEIPARPLASRVRGGAARKRQRTGYQSVQTAFTSPPDAIAINLATVASAALNVIEVPLRRALADAHRTLGSLQDR